MVGWRGVGGLAVGLAARNLVGNLIAGASVYAFRVYGLGAGAQTPGNGSHWSYFLESTRVWVHGPRTFESSQDCFEGVWGLVQGLCGTLTVPSPKQTVAFVGCLFGSQLCSGEYHSAQ